MLRLLPLLLCLIFLLPITAIAQQQETQRLRIALAGEAGKSLSLIDRTILQATLAWQDGDNVAAQQKLADDSVANDPLAAIMRAELLRQQALQELVNAGNYARHLAAAKKSLAAADLSTGIQEAKLRLQHFADKLDGITGLPLPILRIADDIYSVVLVDKKRARLFSYVRDNNGDLQRVHNEYAVTGSKAGDKRKRGDLRTPNGVYHVMQKLEDAQLPDRYGPMAFPLNYPNTLDRLLKKNGGGIWLHGYDYAAKRRPPLDTKGCVSLANDRLSALSDCVSVGHSLVVIGENISFVAQEKRQSIQNEISNALEKWRQDWQNRNHDDYIANYHATFHSLSKKMNKKAWSVYKKRVNANKSFINIDIEQDSINILLLPSVPELLAKGKHPITAIALTEFVQHYKSDNYNGSSHKVLYWVRTSNNDKWQILLEE
ncbi:MAG: L,D-transpeptidase family protein [Mariprofundales bacterium]